MQALALCLLMAIVTISQSSSHHSPLPPVLGTWQVIGTAPPGFVRHGAEVARLTLSLQHGHLHALVLTGSHRYAASAQYSATRHELLLSVHTVKGLVRLQATLGPGSERMIGTWSDTRGDDGGFVLVRLVVPSIQHGHE